MRRSYPDKWGSSGVMTFVVNQQGRVYQNTLGPNTGKLAEAIGWLRFCSWAF